ncbi:MAG: ribonuclease HI family protein [Candidatus Bipolaricaulaceae bacterium]
MRKLFVSVDGSSRGNPGEASIGAVLTDERGHVVEEVSQSIGRATNNVAEYKALIEGVRRAAAYAPEEAVFLTDSHLVANQINGLYKIREPHLQHLNQIAVELLAQLPKWRVNYVEREANSAAHRLAELAFRQRAKSEREKAQLRQGIQDALQDLTPDQLRKVVAFLQRLHAESA